MTESDSSESLSNYCGPYYSMQAEAIGVHWKPGQAHFDTKVKVVVDTISSESVDSSHEDG